MRIDHLAIAVRDLEKAARQLNTLFGYSPETETVTNTRQEVRVLFLRKPGSIDIKLISPSSDTSSLWDFVRKGGGLHHVCFKVPDVSQACADLSALGARVIAPPQPGEAFDDGLIAFVYAGLGLNVEIIDTERRRARLTDKIDGE